MNNINSFLSKMWVLDSNINNAVISSGIKHMAERVLLEGVHTVVNSDGVSTMSSLLVSNGVSIEDTTDVNYDYSSSLTAIYKLFTGLELSEGEVFAKNTDTIYSLLSKLTSYTVQPIKTVNSERSIYAPYSTIESLNSDVGLINVTDASIKGPYELETFTVIGDGNDFRDTSDTSIRLNRSIIDVTTGLTAYGIMEDIEFELIVAPTMSTEVVNSYYDPYAPGALTASNNFKDETLLSVGRPIVTTLDLLNDQQVSGVSSDVDVSVETTPTMTTEVVNSSYQPFSPSGITDSNSVNYSEANLAVSGVTDTNIDVSSTQSVVAISSDLDVTVDVTPTMTTEVVNSSYEPFSPTATTDSNSVVYDEASLTATTSGDTVETLDTVPTSVTYTDDTSEDVVDNLIVPTAVITII